ncbi:MAG: general secretion pathway protein GspK [Gemmatimonadaceae bacterium]
MRGRQARARRRRGFALLAVLWVMTGVAALSLGIALIARDGVTAVQNRIDMARAAWRAEGCLERARAVISRALARRTESLERDASWLTLDRVVASAAVVTAGRCNVALHAAGSAIDVGTADEELLRAIFGTAVGDSRGADSLVATLLDWRDADDDPRPRGAEREWYEAQGRPPPRNGAPAHVRELARVRGFEAFAGLDTLLGVEPGRIALNHAPLAVLAALPGFTDETVARVAKRRLRGEVVLDLVSLAGDLSPASRDALSRRYPDLARLTTAEPDAWVVTSRATSGTRAVAVTVEARIARAGDRGAIVRRRSWVD